MPRSPIRRKRAYTPPPQKATVRLGSPRWLVPTMLFFFIAGIVWIVLWQVTDQQLPVASWGLWNLGAGFGLISVGFVLSTQWR